MKEEFIQRSWLRRVFITLGIFIGLFAINDSQAQKLKKSLLWSIEGNEIQKSYVFGTFHMLPQDDFELKEKVKIAFQAVDQIVMELDMDDPGMQVEMMKNIQMKDGKTLDQFMTEEDLDILNEQLMAAANLTASQVNTFKPFMVETFLLPTFIEGTPASYEMTFVQMAMDRSMPMEGLEEVADQVSVFDKIPYEKQVEDLLDILRNRSNMEELFARMIELYKKEDINKLYVESLDYFDDAEVDLLLHKRNANWIERMTQFSREKSTFYAVGAGHLGGEKGVIQLLMDAGYTVKPIMK